MPRLPAPRVRRHDRGSRGGPDHGLNSSMTNVGNLVDHLFRTSAGQMVAYLARLLGPEHLDLAEEVVQDALLKAFELWPHSGIPENPGGWLFRVARNTALDAVRRNAVFAHKAQELSRELSRGQVAA